MRGDSYWGGMGLYKYACNTRVASDRAQVFLGYEPDAPPLLMCLEADLLATVEDVKKNGPTHCPGIMLLDQAD